MNQKSNVSQLGGVLSISRGQKHRMAETEHLDLAPTWSVGQGVSKRWGEQSREPQKARKRQPLTGWVHMCVPGIMIGILYGFIIFNPHKHPLKVSAMNNLYPAHFAYNLMKEAYLLKKKTNLSYIFWCGYGKDHTPWSSVIYPRDARIFQYTQINQCDTSHQQTDE